MKVVGTLFFKNQKLLIDKPRKRPTYQMIGGRVEEGETPLEAAIRECHEELGDEAIFDSSLIDLVMEFDEIATSDGKTPIHFYVFKYNGELKGKIKTSDEIESFKWYESKDGQEILSNTLKNEVVPYCLNKRLIKWVSTNTQINMVVSLLGNILNTETRLEHLVLTLIHPIAKYSQF